MSRVFVCMGWGEREEKVSKNGVGDGLRGELLQKFCAKGEVECLCAWSEDKREKLSWNEEGGRGD